MSTELIDVQMPDGTIISGVPKGITQSEVQRRYQASQQPSGQIQPKAPAGTNEVGHEVGSSLLGSQLIGVDPFTLLKRLSGPVVSALSTVPGGDVPHKNIPPPELGPQEDIGVKATTLGSAVGAVGEGAASLWNAVKARMTGTAGRENLPTVAKAVLSPRDFLREKAESIANAPAAAREAAASEEAARIAATGTTEKMPLEQAGPLNIPKPGVSPENQQFLQDVRAGRIGIAPKVDAPTLNKAMNISEKQVAHGANPGKRVLDEGLLAKTPQETADNVKMALDDSGGKLESALRQATKKGVTINAQDTVVDALNDAQKRIGTPKDMIFQNQLNGVLDDIMKRYPKLGVLTPEEAHALKVELGNAIHWSGSNYDAPVNRAMVRIYSEMNSQLKDIEGVASEQSRWGDLYNASKGLKKTLDRALVGRGSWLQP